MFEFLSWIVWLILFIKLLIWIWNRINRREFEWTTNNGRYWAVITGCTDGIGFEFARQLAEKGYNLMMLSRNPEKLQLKRQLILNEFDNKIEIKTLAVDFTQTDIYGKIEEFLKPNLNEIYILVNNVGIADSTELYNYYEDDPQYLRDIVNVNIIATQRMTELILPKMIKMKRGLVLNLSSILYFHPMMGSCAYNATKAFLHHFSRIQYLECLPKNVLVFALTPAFVQSNMVPFKSSILVATSKQYVENALKSINWSDSYSFGYLPHSFSNLFLKILEFFIGWQWKTKFLSFFSKKLVDNEFTVNFTLENLFKIIKSFKNNYYNNNNDKND